MINKNRFTMQISWKDVKVVNETLTSIENAYKYSTVPTEFILILNGQTKNYMDTPINDPEEQWIHFMSHPFVKHCEIVHITDKDPIFGPPCVKREFSIKNGLNYWGDADCLLPLEYFYISETFDKQCKTRPYILTFAARKMWGGWEPIEHCSIQNIKNEDIKDGFMRFADPISLETLYAFNEKWGDPTIITIPFVVPGQPLNTIESPASVLSDQMPDNLYCPDLLIGHDDYCLQWSRLYHKIPQYHVTNILKGHHNTSPLKDYNIVRDYTGYRCNMFNDRLNLERELLLKWVGRLFNLPK
jgi:hypothetical protein